MSHTACRHAPGSVRRGDGAALRCRHGSADRSGTPGKVPVESCRWPGLGRDLLGSVRWVGVPQICSWLLWAAARVLGWQWGPLLLAAAADVGLLEGGVLLTRVSTRSAVSRSVNRAVTVARSVSRRASRSLTFVFSALIWSNIVGVVLGMVAVSGFRLLGMINLAGV